MLTQTGTQRPPAEAQSGGGCWTPDETKRLPGVDGQLIVLKHNLRVPDAAVAAGKDDNVRLRRPCRPLGQDRIFHEGEDGRRIVNSKIKETLKLS